MAIGSVLLQPQRLERAGRVPSQDAVLDDIIGLAVCLMIDATRGGRLGETLFGSLQGTVLRLTARAGAGVDSAAMRFRALLAPLIESVQEAVEQPPGDVDELVDRLESGLKSVVSGLEDLNPEQIRQAMRTVFEIIETDLGITPTFIQDVVLGFFDDMVLSLKRPRPGETPDERENRRAAAAHLGRIRRFIRANFTFPVLHAEVAAQAFITLRQRPDVDAVLARALCSGKAVVAGLRAGGELVDLLPYSASLSFGEGSLGAAAAPSAREAVSFFASKLLEHDNYDGDLGKLPLQLLDDGMPPTSLFDAFRNASVVLARSAFVYTVDAEEWRVVDRKQYVLAKVASRIWVYRLFVIGENEFLRANQGDLSELRKIFRENGIPLHSTDRTVVHEEGSNAWDITAGGWSFTATRFEGEVTIRPKTLVGVLFTLSADLQPGGNEKAPSPSLRTEFESNGIPLSPLCSLSVREPGSEWLLDDGDFEYTLKRDGEKLEISTGGCLGALRALINAVLGVPKGHMVWVNRERTQVLLGQRILHTGSNVSWEDAPVFKRLDGNRYYSLKNAAGTAEGWAYNVSWIQDVIDIILFAIKIGLSIDKNEVQYSISSNSLEAGQRLSEMIAKLAKHRPVSELVGIGAWYDFSLWLGINVVKVIEAALTPSAPSPPTTANDFSKLVDKGLSAAVGVEIADTHWNELASEFILSLLTLINHVEPAEASQHRPENFKENGGFVDLFWKGGLIAYTAAVPDSEYALPFQTASLTAGYGLGGAVGVGLVTGFVGLVFAQGAVARAPLSADVGHVFKTLGKSAGKSLLYFFPYLKLVKGRV